MSLSSAKAKLDAQGGDPVTGYISKTDHQESYDELVDDTALTGATTAEAIAVSGAAVAATINGRDPDDLVAGPASATDNALVRFDGTGGKTVQNSGITVDDSGNISSDLTVSKASPTLNVSASSGSAIVQASAATAATAAFRWRSGSGGTTVKWAWIRDTDDGLYLYRYPSSGVINTVIDVSTGKWTFRDVGATAGLELGASGPRIMSGTGSPEGVVTAPVGSMWTDTAATTGAIRWVKASGSGSSGWVVEYGDTGWRNVSAEIFPAHLALNPNAKVLIRRVGKQVTVTYASGASPTATGLQQLTDSDTIPSGFQHTAYATGVNPTGITIDAGTGYGASVSLYMSSVSILRSGNQVSGTGYNGSVTYPTNDAWPTSLPGSAA